MPVVQGFPATSAGSDAPMEEGVVEGPVPDPPQGDIVVLGDAQPAGERAAPDPSSLQHLLTHKPAHPKCEACMRGKLKERRHYKGAFKRDTSKWGDLVTCDHLVSRSDEMGISVQKHTDALVVVDTHTRGSNIAIRCSLVPPMKPSMR